MNKNFEGFNVSLSFEGPKHAVGNPKTCCGYPQPVLEIPATRFTGTRNGFWEFPQWFLGILAMDFGANNFGDTRNGFRGYLQRVLGVPVMLFRGTLNAFLGNPSDVLLEVIISNE